MQGFAFSKDCEMSIDFEKDFPYELTNDQKFAIDEIVNGEKANYRLLPPRNGNSVIIIYFEKLICRCVKTSSVLSSKIQ